MMESPDREQRVNYVVRIRCVRKTEIAEREVPVFFYTLYVQDVEHQVLGNCLFCSAFDTYLSFG